MVLSPYLHQGVWGMVTRSKVVVAATKHNSCYSCVTVYGKSNFILKLHLHVALTFFLLGVAQVNTRQICYMPNPLKFVTADNNFPLSASVCKLVKDNREHYIPLRHSHDKTHRTLCSTLMCVFLCVYTYHVHVWLIVQGVTVCMSL